MLFCEDSLEERLKRTVMVVEATHAEQHFLWEEWSSESRTSGAPGRPKLHWEQVNPGYSTVLGMLDDMPVVLCIFWARIEGQWVLFWEMTSMVTDHRKAETWLENNLKPYPLYDHGRKARCDAMNFHHAVAAIQEAAERTKYEGKTP